MQALKLRFNYLFKSTRGLVLVAIGLIALVTAIFGMLSGPMAEFGIRDMIVRVFGMDMVELEREGRIILLYHAIAVAVVAIEVYFITEIVPMKEHQQTMIIFAAAACRTMAITCVSGRATTPHRSITARWLVSAVPGE